MKLGVGRPVTYSVVNPVDPIADRRLGAVLKVSAEEKGSEGTKCDSSGTINTTTTVVRAAKV